MAGRAKSTTQKQREAHQAHDDLMFQAVYAYRRELAKAPGIQCRGARTICKDFEQINLQSMGKLVKLSYCTLIRLAAEGRSKAKANAADKSWLTGEEAKVVLSFTEETGN
ncbi:hypothetical protein BDR03DRAFT_1004419 [Suillus americanus]|nr:hypothetical protein BDR03DRAFT_1004419 [Suillus americanus]